MSLHAPTGIRTRVTALKGLCPWPLDERGILVSQGVFKEALASGLFAYQIIQVEIYLCLDERGLFRDSYTERLLSEFIHDLDERG